MIRFQRYAAVLAVCVLVAGGGAAGAAGSHGSKNPPSGTQLIDPTLEPPPGGWPLLGGAPPEIVPIGSTPTGVTPRDGASDQGSVESATARRKDFFQCDQNALCLWQFTSYTGQFYADPANQAPRNTWLYLGGFDNVPTSLYNKRANATLISRYFPPSNDIACVPAQWAYGNLANNTWPSGANVDNTISSYNYLTNGC